MITGVAVIIKTNPWFMIMRGEVPNSKKMRIHRYVKTKLSERKQKANEKDQNQDKKQQKENSFENFSEIENDPEYHDPEYQSYLYKTYGDEISQYQTAIKKPRNNPQATLSKRKINPKYLADAPVKTKEAIRKLEETDPEGELELPQSEVLGCLSPPSVSYNFCAPILPGYL